VPICVEVEPVVARFPQPPAGAASGLLDDEEVPRGLGVHRHRRTVFLPERTREVVVGETLYARLGTVDPEPRVETGIARRVDGQAGRAAVAPLEREHVDIRVVAGKARV